MRLYDSIACAILLCSLGLPALEAEDIPRLTSTEAFVLHELKNGRAADLSDKAPSDRVLGQEFVERLVTGGYPDAELERRGVRITHAIFKEKIIVSGTVVPFRVWFEHCIFERGIDFGYTTFDRDLSLEGSQFGVPPSVGASFPGQDDSEVSFVGMKVFGTTVFSGATFYSQVDFTYVEIGSDFLFDDVKDHANGIADFENTKIKGPAFFRRDSFAGILRLNDAELFELFIEDFTSAVDLDLMQAHVERKLSIKNIQLNSWKARFLMSNGEVRLDRITPVGLVDLAHSRFQNIAITGFEEWLKLKPGTMNLEGFSFDGVDINDNTNNNLPAARLLELINSESCPYSPQPYMELEKFFRAHGDSQKADEVYIDMRRRQRQKLAWMNRPWDWVLDKTLGYGRQTWRTGFFAIFLIIVGAVLFAPNRMKWKDPKQPPGRYNRFWYSLDQLAPVIDLEASKNWSPKEDNGWTRNYALFQRIAGWILVPLILGAITGIVK